MDTKEISDEEITRLNILLVDDDPIFHLINSTVLKHVGVTSISSKVNGREALDWITKHLEEKQPIPDVVFVDLDMPVLNGFEFIEGLQKATIPKQFKIGIAILTSSVNTEDKDRAKTLGVNQYLVKPLTETSARKTLESLIS